MYNKKALLTVLLLLSILLNACTQSKEKDISEMALESYAKHVGDNIFIEKTVKISDKEVVLWKPPSSYYTNKLIAMGLNEVPDIGFFFYYNREKDDIFYIGENLKIAKEHTPTTHEYNIKLISSIIDESNINIIIDAYKKIITKKNDN